MLDKMFPKPGETEPEIRFEGFTDPREQRKLGEHIQLGGSGETPSATNQNYYGGEKYPFSVLSTLREGILLIRPKRSQKKACAIVRHGLFWLAR